MLSMLPILLQIDMEVQKGRFKTTIFYEGSSMGFHVPWGRLVSRFDWRMLRCANIAAPSMKLARVGSLALRGSF